MKQLRLFFGLIAAPLVWILYRQAAITILPWSCADGNRVMIAMTAAAAMLAVLGSCWLSWQSWRSAEPTHSSHDIADAQRAKLIALSAFAVSILFALLLLVSALPIALVRVCG